MKKQPKEVLVAWNEDDVKNGGAAFLEAFIDDGEALDVKGSPTVVGVYRLIGRRRIEAGKPIVKSIAR